MINFQNNDIPLKFNIFLGEFINELTNSPTIKTISKELFSARKKDFILFDNNLSLPEIAQNLLDDVVLEKKEILEILNNIFSTKYKYNNNFYKQLLDSNLFSSIISSSYDYIFEDYFFDMINKHTPFILSDDELEKVSFYKIYGDLKNPDKFALSSQDIKRLKILGFYEVFWQKIRKDMCKNSTILFGININDSSFMGILDFILSKIQKQHKPIYLYVDKFVKSETLDAFLEKYNILVINGENESFIPTIENYFPELRKTGDSPHLEYA